MGRYQVRPVDSLVSCLSIPHGKDMNSKLLIRSFVGGAAMSWICQAGLSAYPKVGGIKMGRRHQVQSMLSVVTTFVKYPLSPARMLLPALIFPKEGPSHLVSLLSPHEVEACKHWPARTEQTVIQLFFPPFARQTHRHEKPSPPYARFFDRPVFWLRIWNHSCVSILPCFLAAIPSVFSHHHHQPPCPSFFLRFFGPPNQPSHGCPLGHALFLSATRLFRAPFLGCLKTQNKQRQRVARKS